MEQYYGEQLEYLCNNIRPADVTAMEAAAGRWDSIAKPIEGLGLLEQMIIKIAGVQKTEQVSLDKKAVVVFCADNGVVAEGVTQTDGSVTAVVTENLAKGVSVANQMAAVAGADVIPVDIGVAGEIGEAGVQNCKVAYGTANLRREPAMTMEQAFEAIHKGIAIAGQLKDAGYHLLAAGEMGIGNTTTSSAIASVMLDEPVEAVTGRGAGLSKEGLRQKIHVIQEAITLHHPDSQRPLEVLAALGGFDIAGLCGLLLGGAVYRIPVILDGIVSLTAALLAQKLCPTVIDYMLPSHMGKEPVCKLAMKHLGLAPMIYGQLALGEGTGAVMLLPMLDMAYAVYRKNRTFADIQVAPYRRFEKKSS